MYYYLLKYTLSFSKYIYLFLHFQVNLSLIFSMIYCFIYLQQTYGSTTNSISIRKKNHVLNIFFLLFMTRLCLFV
jgi:hypothetical protein